ncbi:hypothetical protein [Consotaella salsifontis]|uniref:hypothetical protein n=1 Tax=Consotaella salsifontis TaxID=1365950 RepID=UPI00105603C5|nr:hypothetical protein [Consotaella salsifontis]
MRHDFSTLRRPGSVSHAPINFGHCFRSSRRIHLKEEEKQRFSFDEAFHRGASQKECGLAPPCAIEPPAGRHRDVFLVARNLKWSQQRDLRWRSDIRSEPHIIGTWPLLPAQ